MQVKELDSPVWTAKPTRQPMRILVIEDDREAAGWLVKGLAESGHVADHASDGEEGLNMASEAVHDVLIVDRMLPKLDGLAIIRSCARVASRLPFSSSVLSPMSTNG